MRFMRILYIAMIVVLALTGCAKGSTGGGDEATYPSAVIWNNTLYGLSQTEVPPQDIDKELGKIQNIVTPMPQNNAESNVAPVGSLLLEINGVDPLEAIAVKLDGKCYKATQLHLVNDVRQ